MPSSDRLLAELLGSSAGTTGSWARRFAQGVASINGVAITLGSTGSWKRRIVQGAAIALAPPVGSWDRRLGGEGTQGSWARRLALGEENISDLEDETVAALAARTTPASQQETLRLNGLILALKNAGVWNVEIKFLHLYAVETEQAARINLINPSQVGTVVGTEGAHWLFTPSTGYTILSNSGRVDSGIAWNTLCSQNDAMLGVYSLDTSFQAGSIVTNPANTGIRLTVRTSANQAGVRVNASASVATAAIVMNGYGLMIAQRTSSSVVQIYQNGTKLGADLSSTSTAPVSDNLRLANASASLDKRPIAAMIAGTSMSAEKHALVASALGAYLSSVEPNIWGSVVTLDMPAQQHNLPDIEGYTITAGKGFTGTGLAYLGNGQLFVGDNGTYGTQNDSFNSSNTRPKGHTITSNTGELVSSVDVFAIDASGTSLQGVVIDNLGNRAFARTASNRLLVATPADTIALNSTQTLSGGINGLTFDTKRRHYYASGINDIDLITIINTQGQVSGTFKLPVSAEFSNDTIDHLSFDSDRDQLLVSKGINGSTGFVYVIDCETKRAIVFYQLGATLAMEGIVRVGSDLWCVTDEYFHIAGSQLNKLQRYVIP